MRLIKLIICIATLLNGVRSYSSDEDKFQAYEKILKHPFALMKAFREELDLEKLRAYKEILKNDLHTLLAAREKLDLEKLRAYKKIYEDNDKAMQAARENLNLEELRAIESEEQTHQVSHTDSANHQPEQLE